jgi:hypothetical protein
MGRRVACTLAALTAAAAISGCGAAQRSETTKAETASPTARTPTTSPLTATPPTSTLAPASTSAAATQPAAPELPAPKPPKPRYDPAAKEAHETAASKAAEKLPGSRASASAAQRLIESWKRQPVAASDPQVRTLQRHLTSLTHKCSQSEATLAGYIAGAIRTLKGKGFKESPVELARALDTAAPGKDVMANCRSVLKILLAEVESG